MLGLYGVSKLELIVVCELVIRLLCAGRMTDWSSTEVQDKDLRWPEGKLLRFLCSIELFSHKVWQIDWDHYLSSHIEVTLEMTFIR
jgi:hypothetical protein